MAGCYRCGGEMQAPGALISAVSRASFRPQESKFLTLETGDVNKLRRLTGDPEPGTEKFLKEPGPSN